MHFCVARRALDGVHVEVVVRVDVPRPHAPVVARRAELLLVAVRAELRVVRGDVLVALDEVRRVLRVVQPARRLHRAAREHVLRRPPSFAPPFTWHVSHAAFASPRAAASGCWWQPKQPRMRGI